MSLILHPIGQYDTSQVRKSPNALKMLDATTRRYAESQKSKVYYDAPFRILRRHGYDDAESAAD
jgi:hypothetical protein